MNIRNIYSELSREQPYNLITRSENFKFTVSRSDELSELNIKGIISQIPRPSELAKFLEK